LRKRHGNWRTNLNALITARQETPFEWGQNDCCLWAADAILAQTGEDPAEKYRGTYSSELGAFRAMKRNDKVDNTDRLAQKLIGEPIHPALAQVGDIVLFQSALGVCYGRNALFVGQEQLIGDAIEGHEGLLLIPMQKMSKAYRV